MTTDIYCDGACRGNPGRGAWAFLVIENETEIYKQTAAIAEKTTNNRAEYTSIAKALLWAHATGRKSFTIYSDSELIINQIKRIYRCKEPELIKSYENIQSIIQMIAPANIRFEHLSRTTKRIETCDKMCNSTLDETENSTPTPDNSTWIRKITYECPECGHISPEPEEFCFHCDTILVLPAI